MNSFGAALFSHLSKEGNLVVSPYSIYAVLAMAEAGSAGDTKAALDAVLGTDPGSTMTTIDAVVTQMATPSTAAADPGDVIVRPANSLWAQDKFELKTDFVDRLAANYGAGVYLTDYVGNAEGSRAAINDWVRENTRDLIPELVPEGAITPDTLLTLVNALYFGAAWQTEFAVLPAPIPFATPRGERQVPAFGATISGPSAAGDGWRSVTLSYRRGLMAMTLIVPDIGRYDEVADALGPEMIAAATAAGDSKLIRFSMPAFNVTSALDLSDVLRQLRLGPLFDTGLTEMAEGGPLTATGMVHQAVIDVDEKGTTAAAATALMLAGAAPPTESITLSIDRPFLFMIHDIATNAPLFLGRVVDPSL